MVFDPGSLIMGNRENNKRWYWNVRILLHAIHNRGHRGVASLPNMSIWSRIPTLSKLRFRRRNSVDASKPGLQGTEAGQVRLIRRWLRIRRLLKLLDRASPAIVERILIAGIK